ncbi:MAG: hypothetical protein J0I12_27920 [Candidatus Eremiobacteraeota bacterium]|nr:hypothetical protein [Candidatus Eremiobacteraeota bacterium]
MDDPMAPGKRGPKRKFERDKHYVAGAPILNTRIDPDKLDWVKSRPEGTRPYLERIIGEDREKVLAAERLDTGPEAADT